MEKTSIGTISEKSIHRVLKDYLDNDVSKHEVSIGGYIADICSNNTITEIQTVKTELEPTLKNVNKSVEIISGLIIKTDESINKVKDFMSKTPLKFLGKLTTLTGKATKGFFSGLCMAFKMFSKKKK